MKKNLQKLRLLNHDEFEDGLKSTGNDLEDVYNEFAKLEDRQVKSQDVIGTALDVIALGLNDLGQELRSSTVSKNALDEMFNSLRSPFFIVNAETMEVRCFSNTTIEFFKYNEKSTFNIPVEQLVGKSLFR
ncbi:MAG: hypothetical protein HRT71_10000 [Flavobacteriales bacterium]|nr:hypothetical protein [Flavobacteriales bacterium]